MKIIQTKNKKNSTKLLQVSDTREQEHSNNKTYIETRGL